MPDVRFKSRSKLAAERAETQRRNEIAIARTMLPALQAIPHLQQRVADAESRLEAAMTTRARDLQPLYHREGGETRLGQEVGDFWNPKIQELRDEVALTKRIRDFALQVRDELSQLEKKHPEVAAMVAEITQSN